MRNENGWLRIKLQEAYNREPATMITPEQRKRLVVSERPPLWSE